MGNYAYLCRVLVTLETDKKEGSLRLRRAESETLSDRKLRQAPPPHQTVQSMLSANLTGIASLIHDLALRPVVCYFNDIIHFI